MNIINTKGMVTALCLATAAASMAQNIAVTVNGRQVDFAGTEPRSYNGRVLVPLRGVFEEMGAYVDWNAANRTVTATRGQTDVRLRIGDRNAIVDQRDVQLDVPAMLVNGRTMVPLRFLSESLGADVQWMAQSRTVAINSAMTADERFRSDRNLRRTTTTARRVRLAADTVIPVTLDKTLSSDNSRAGEHFTATVHSSTDQYVDLPAGTKIEGVVRSAVPQNGDKPGLLDLDFRRIRLPNGNTKPIDASLIGLDNNSVVRDSEGVYRARNTNKKTDNRVVYAGYGAGAGLIVGLLTKKPLEGAILGGALGYLLGQYKKDNRQASDVTLNRGTEFGVRLNQGIAWNANGSK